MRVVGVLLMLMSVFHPAGADDIVLRTTVEPADPWVGQRVILKIDVLGRDGWAQISRFGEVDLPGAYLLRTESQGTRLQETVDGVAYAGQRYEVSIFPQVAGVIEVPAIPVEVTTRTWGVETQQPVRRRRTPPVTMNARVPPGAEGIRGLISTTRLHAEQQWTPAVSDLVVGDALTRTITLEADDVSAMAFAPIEHADISGVGIYPAAPTVNDSTDRGSLTGRRIEEVTYVFERAGTRQLPDVVLSWWDISANRLETVTLSGLELDVLPAAAGGFEAHGTYSTEDIDWRGLALPAAMLLVLAYLLLGARTRLVQQWRAWRSRREESEARYFRLAIRSIRSADAHTALRDIMRWLDRLNDKGPPAQLQEFLNRYGDAAATAVTEQLMHAVAGKSRLSDPAALIDALKKARKRRRQSGRSAARSQRSLPTLNHG